MTEDLAAYGKCVERVDEQWSRFQERRREHLAQAERFGKAPENVTEKILQDLLTDVLDWTLADLNDQLEHADLVLTSLGIRWMVIEAKRPDSLAWHRGAVEAALDQVCRYAAEQKIRTVTVSDGTMLYTADVVNGGLKDRLYVNLTESAPPPELFWISVHGIYRPPTSIASARSLPESSGGTGSKPPVDTDDTLLHPRYKIPARCFAFVGNASKTATWKLPYLHDDGSIDTKRLPGAISAIVKSYRGVRVGGIPDTAIPDVLVRLGVAAHSIGKLPLSVPSEPATAYEILAVVLDQQGTLAHVIG